MKIYKFNIKSHEGDKLYAYTTNKDYRDIFIALRDMNLFKYDIVKLDKKEYKKFSSKYRTCKLIEPEECKIICTGTEYDYILDEVRFKINEDLVGYSLYDPDLFKPEYFKALRMLEYNLVYEIALDDDAYLENFLQPNIFHSFYVSFKNTFKKG